MIKILCKETNEVHEWTISQVLEEINRERSDEWTAYNHNDWRDGWMEWVEGGEFYTLCLAQTLKDSAEELK
jgi:hypothetical protein